MQRHFNNVSLFHWNLACVASVSVWFRSKRGLSVLTARKMKREPKNDPLPTLLLAPFFARSLTLVPHSLLLNRTKTLATQANRNPNPTGFVFFNQTILKALVWMPVIVNCYLRELRSASGSFAVCWLWCQQSLKVSWSWKRQRFLHTHPVSKIRKHWYSCSLWCAEWCTEWQEKAAGYLHNSRNFRWWGSTEELQEEFHFEERLKNMEKELRIALYNA